MYQNTSHAVMAQRIEAPDSLDDFPTPPWATRALMEHIIHADEETARYSVLEPACGRGHMAQTLREYFNDVRSSDISFIGPSSRPWDVSDAAKMGAKSLFCRKLQL